MEVNLIAATSLVNERFWARARARASAGQLTGTPIEQLCELACRTCYDSLGGARTRSSSELARHVVEAGHINVTYHAYFSWYVSGVSRSLTHELIRTHIGASPSQESTRYVDCEFHEQIPHPLFLTGPQQLPVDVISRYNDTYQRAYDLLTARGAAPMAARKQARGAAARELPQGLESTVTWTMNLAALMNFIDTRATPEADGEIRELAVTFWRQALEYAPAYLTAYSEAAAADGIGTTLLRPTSKQGLAAEIEQLKKRVGVLSQELELERARRQVGG